jgi:hypothetical protein
MLITSDVYSTNSALSASSCGANALPSVALDFGFPLGAAGLILNNNSCGRMFFNLAGRAASTQDAYVSSGAVVDLRTPTFRTCGLGLASTTTSTASGAPYAVTAWASA